LVSLLFIACTPYSSNKKRPVGSPELPYHIDV
jgi:hypothetical protein